MADTHTNAVTLKEAAKREYMATNCLGVPGVVEATELNVTELGHAVVLAQSPDSIRLDQFMAQRTGPLSSGDALAVWHTLASIVRDLHKRGVTHRMLTPESVWLRPTTHPTGHRTVTIDGTVTMLTENQSIYLPLGSVHRLANPGKILLELIEVQTGSYLGEDDIVRFDDKYGRVPA